MHDEERVDGDPVLLREPCPQRLFRLAGRLRLDVSPAVRDPVDVCVDACLLYTSDAADDLLCVDLGGGLIIKKKKTKYPAKDLSLINTLYDVMSNYLLD